MEKNQQRTVMIKLFWLCIFTFSVNARIHKLKLENDDRKEITLSTFGFLTKGTLAVYVDSFSISPKELMKSNTTLFGFTLGRSNSVGLSSYMEDMQKTCFLNHKDKETNAVFFHFDFIQKRINIVRLEHLKELEISSKRREDFLREHNLNLVLVDGDESQPDVEPKQPEGEVGATVAGVDQVMFTPQTSLALNLTDQGNRTEPAQNETVQISPPIHSTVDSPLLQFVDLVETADGFKGHFLVYIKKSEEEGLYSLLFHNCPSQNLDSAIEISIALTIIEDNNGNFLTAGEMPVPALYFLFCILFFIAAVAWLSVLHSSREDVYKIHYMMLVVVFVKSLACLFHGVNMYFIQIKGIHEEAWAILWYIVYLTRGALMFVTVLLIGAGWAFIKHVLSVKEKKLFLIVIPLQILAQVAEVIVEESEEGGQSYMTWKEIFILVDLLCCGAILFPVVWSIRHLHEASQTDGKAAINLQKLKLFRHFYILVVCYIYFTRIIVYLMKITLPFKFEWLTDLFKELAMLVFFTITGSKFRPATNNPYLQVPLDSDDEDIEMEEVLTKTGVTEGVVRVNQKQEVVTNQVKQRESSHEYD